MKGDEVMSNRHYLVFKDTQSMTAQEKEWLKIMQRGVGVDDDGFFGMHTLMTSARELGDPPLPIDGYFYNQYMMYDKPENVVVFNPEGKGLRGYENTIAGSFANTSAVPPEPGSIMINNGEVIQPNACHGWMGCPESVLYRLNDGTIGMLRAKSTFQIPLDILNNIDWAIGGLGLIKDGDSEYYNPVLEGFSGKYSDVLRDTDHDVFFIDKWGWFGVINVEDLTTPEVIKLLESVFAVYAIQGDGGGWDAVNGTIKKKNLDHPQWYAVQCTGGTQ
jgi:hypothetical protein